MARGRKYEPNHRDRLLGSFVYTPDQSSGGDHSELAEEDVWSTINEGIHRDVGAARVARASRRCGEHGESTEDRHVGGLSLAFEDAAKGSSRILHQFRGENHVGTGPSRGGLVATSLPVNVPDWPKIPRVNSAESMQEGYDAANGDDEEWVPPHEYLAQSRRSAAHSVFEGVGRTLKGRDMSRVRNAVWSRTGFYG